MHHAEIARLFDATGPFVSVYLATEGDVEQAAERVALRWKNLRAGLLRDGVPEATLAAIDPLVEGSHTAGSTLAVIAAADGVLLSSSLPEPPARDAGVRHGALPDVLPLLAAAQAAVPHVAVLTDRTGADLAARVADGGGRSEHVAGRDSPHIHKPQAGGWSQPRYHHRAEALWESNAGEVADALTRLVDQVRPRFVAAAGDVRALQLLREHAPKRVRELIQVVGGEYGSLDAVFAAADKLVAATVEADTEALLERFAEERGDRAVEGAAATLAALGRGQVGTLLVAGPVLDDQRTAWFGPAPTDVAGDRDALAALGVATPSEGRLVDVAVRAALGTGATVRLVDPGRRDGPRDGLGGLLRFASRAPAG
ncbi:MAG TPA: Vms1/Ankzf1 family peptidyl-tRNA hydrolase [Actinomycetota bacterium]|nr:Vms1/Ankzf1 family peptidyl-tRNA hydrolase [Actinomycetota bacterium]